MRPQPAPANFLSGPYLDRRAERRDDPDWHIEALRDSSTRFVLTQGTAQLIRSEPRPHVEFVDARHPLVAEARPESMLLLGWYHETRCVLVEVDATSVQRHPPPAEARFEELRPLAPLLDHNDAGLLAYARAMSWWRARHRYCAACGAPANPVRAGHVVRCSNAACGIEVFPRIDPAIIVLVTDGERALLGRQASWPPGRWSTIAGFVEPGESLEDAVAREVAEETSVRVTASTYHSSQPWPFPSSLMLGFMAEAAPGAIACADAELEDARWFTRAQIAAGEARLPPRTSISHRLISHWFDAGWPAPLATLGGQGW
jgi:NAD+ diphosphatase